MTRRSPDRRLLVGRTMVAVAVAGVIVALAGVVVGWRLVGDLRDTTTESLAVTLETLDSVEDTIALSEQVLAAIRETVATTESTLQAVDASFAAGSSVLLEVGDLTDSVGPSLADAARILRQLEGIGSTIDSLLGDLSQVPFGPDYEPDRELGETFGALAETVGDLPAQFEAASADLAEFDRSVLDISAQLDDLTVAVGEVRGGLDGSVRLIAQYRRNVEDARAIALTTGGDLDNDVTLMRILLVVGGLVMAFGQIVPFWLGRQLLRRRDDLDDLGERDVVV